MRTKTPSARQRREAPSRRFLASRRPIVRPREGKGALVLLGILALAACASAWFWIAQERSPAPLPALDRAVPVESTASAAPQADATPLESASRDEIDPHADHPPLVRPVVFDGRGAIRGRVIAPPGVTLPEHFQVVVEPARFTVGSERAERREVEASAAAPEFAFEDLPQAGYRVYAKARGMSSRITEVALVKNSSEIYKIIELRDAGFVDGSVRDAAGNLPEGLCVTLDDLLTGDRLQTRTDAAGMWHIDGVQASRYRVLFGYPEQPLVPAEELDFSGAFLHYPDRTIPETASVILRVVDEWSDPLVDAQIRGWGVAAGPFDLRTGPNGIARVPFLRAGAYHLEIEHETGRKGKTTIRLAGDERERVYQIVCRTPEADARIR
jgi:hypothetical protein